TLFTYTTLFRSMESGIIQQVGTPFEVYNSPNNAFVASFIGSPAMNLHEVTYSQGRITGQGIDLAVSEPSRKVLDEKGYEGKKVIFGIRPEDIHSEQIALDTTPETVVDTTITLAELTRAESILYIN